MHSEMMFPWLISVVVLWGHVGVMINPTLAGIVDNDSAITRSLALLLAEEGVECFANDVTLPCLWKLQDSFKVYPTSIVASYIGKAIEMLYIEITSGRLDPIDGIEIPQDTPVATAYLHAAQNWYQKAYDLDSTNPFLMRALASNFQFNRDYSQAKYYFEKAIEYDANNSQALFEYGSLLQLMGDIEGAFLQYDRCLIINPKHYSCLLNIATLHHYFGEISSAVNSYRGLESKVEIDSAIVAGSTVFGERNVAMLCPEYRSAKLNIGVAYYQQGILSQALSELSNFDSDAADLSKSLACSSPSGESGLNSNEFQQWQVVVEALVGCTSRKSRKFKLATECDDLRSERISAIAIILKPMRSACHWKDWEKLHEDVISDGIRSIFIATRINSTTKYASAMLPFDTLQLPVDHSFRLAVAAAHSDKIVAAINDYNQAAMVRKWRQNQALRLGFISYDINDHPTAHLVEGIFQLVSQQRMKLPLYKRIELVLFSYGKDDGSSCRKRLMDLADKFIDLILLSHEESKRVIKSENIDILFDMQLHTLGHRQAIMAGKPALIQANYLVYPGTSGTKFHDLIVVDANVVPPEHVGYYSESLLVLPPSYQVSFYDVYVSATDSKTVDGATLMETYNFELLRRSYGLPINPHAIVLCNFNKIDKIDPVTLAVWMELMKSAPNTYLWLLEPTPTHSSSHPSSVASGLLPDGVDNTNVNMAKELKFRLKFEVEAAGVSWDRVIFAPRVSKQEHIARHAAADLFIDSFVYGAHSTATDALRGGLPVLTVTGNSFTSRVGYSLLSSFTRDSSIKQNTLRFPLVFAVESLKEFVMVAIKLIRSETSNRLIIRGSREVPLRRPSMLSLLKEELVQSAQSRQGLFNTRRAVDEFMHASMSVIEARQSPVKRKQLIRYADICHGRAECPEDNISPLALEFVDNTLPHVCLVAKQ